VIPSDDIDFEEVVRRSRVACAALSEADDGLKRDILSHAGNRWSLAVVYALAAHGTLRHAELARSLEGVTQRMLTRTLRQLERDGLISRHDYREVPPRVDYSLTLLGQGLLVGMMPIWTWVLDHAEQFREARRQFEIREAEKSPTGPGPSVSG
jgi:DNA-binding HxlR family transcriptional regulator